VAVVGSPAYFQRHAPPTTPQDLTEHNCINMRLPTHGSLFPWEFEKDGRELRVRVEGQLTFNTIRPRLDAACRGLGLAYMPEDIVASQIASGELVRVLEDWCSAFPGYHLYYPNRRHPSPAFALLVEALRYREGD
jgi:DNA-binding transcriptional LysR family regulator